MSDSHRPGGEAEDTLHLSLGPFPVAPGLFSLVSLREDVHIEIGSSGDPAIYSRWEEAPLPAAQPQVLDAVRRMSLGPILLGNVLTGPDQVAELRRVLIGLEHLVVRSIGLDPARPALSVTPLTPQARFGSPTGLKHPVRLSRFTTIRSDGAGFVLESPLALFRVVVHSPEAMAWVARLMRPVSPADMDAQMLAVAGYLVAAAVAVEASQDPVLTPVRYDEDEDPALAGWNPTDLMFHTRSTTGRHDHDFGALYPMGTGAGIEPVMKAAGTGRVVDLPAHGGRTWSPRTPASPSPWRVTADSRRSVRTS